MNAFIPISSPHLHAKSSIPQIMLQVHLALLPAVLASIWLFGWLAVGQIFTAVLVAVAAEAVALRLRSQGLAALGDGSAALTGLLLALTLPPALPLGLTAVASAFAILVVKHAFGGLGWNPFNPAIAARVMLMVSFPLPMTLWLTPQPLGAAVDLYDLSACWPILLHGLTSLPNVDAITTATPLGAMHTALRSGEAAAAVWQGWDPWQAALGLRPGSLGETSAVALLAGGIWLLWRGVISWHIPLSYLATLALFAAISHAIAPERFAPALVHLLSGGVMLAAWFMATDPVSSPSTPAGRLAFGIGCGALTWLMRNFGAYPEGAMFAVMLMNAASPLIERHLRPRVYGR